MRDESAAAPSPGTKAAVFLYNHGSTDAPRHATLNTPSCSSLLCRLLGRASRGPGDRLAPGWAPLPRRHSIRPAAPGLQPSAPPPAPDQSPAAKKPDASKPAAPPTPPTPKPASEITLHAGAAAPPIKADAWIKTQAITTQPDIASFESGKVYIVGGSGPPGVPRAARPCPGSPSSRELHAKEPANRRGLLQRAANLAKTLPDHRLDHVPCKVRR